MMRSRLGVTGTSSSDSSSDDTRSTTSIGRFDAADDVLLLDDASDAFRVVCEVLPRM